MESLYLLIPLSVLIVFVAIAVFLLMSSNGQFEDTVGPAHRILFDNDLPETASERDGDTQQHFPED